MTARKREVWLDVLRILSAFLVIVNHTNSDLFKAADPSQGVWWLSILWYALSKIAVPVFVMVSGAVLLGRQDSPRRALWRFVRVLAALLVFSYGYFLHHAWVYYGLWPRMLDWKAFFSLVWTQQITDGFWYLYFYLGLMLMLPLLQRLSLGMRPRETLYLIGMCFLWDAVFPLLAHYAPAAALPEHLQAPLFTGYIGLFFAGYWIRTKFVPSRGRMLAAAGSLVLSLGLTAALLRMEFDHTGGIYYWKFLDDRMHPSMLNMIAAVSAMMLAKGLCCRWPSQPWTELGGCAFGIYLLQDWVIAQSETRLYAPLAAVLSGFPAMLVWEFIVFAVCLLAAWIIRRIPLLKKIVS